MPQRRAIFAAGALAVLGAGRAGKAVAQGAAPTLTYRQVMVPGGGGTPIATYEYGNPEGIPILLVHGFGQCNLSWDKQIADPALAREFRLVTMDFRGHGLSGKPEGDEHYKPGAMWAADLRGIITALDLRRPVLVGWSYGGRVLNDYLAAHGTSGIGALNFVDAVTGAPPGGAGPAGVHTGPNGYGHADLRMALDGTRRFLRACFERQPTQDEFETMMGFNTMVPRHVRLSLLGRPAEYEAGLRAVDVPTLVTQGEADALITPVMARYTAATVPGARLSLYVGIGHAPFWEDAPRFNRELAGLARSARR
ncbi:alpha/beta fold hydrolase [Roseomonas sp. CCTCC AB2023176]|uniref:alpha/beta fold hydrolase n=1 Tax=Roseomonas sp. CCTCC AB2023176 TaxID=3342640 RepID=UPI0035E29A72